MSHVSYAFLIFCIDTEHTSNVVLLTSALTPQKRSIECCALLAPRNAMLVQVSMSYAHTHTLSLSLSVSACLCLCLCLCLSVSLSLHLSRYTSLSLSLSVLTHTHAHTRTQWRSICSCALWLNHIFLISHLLPAATAAALLTAFLANDSCAVLEDWSKNLVSEFFG